MSLLPVDEAKSRLLAKARPISDVETVPLDIAAHRMLASDVQARLTQPPFDSSAMDGYALRAADASHIGCELTVIGTAAAGHAFEGVVGSGQAVRIFTGAPVPEGADSILIQEDAEKLSSDRITTGFVVSRGRHIRPMGQDFTQGETVLTAGTLLDFSHITVAAAMNHATLPVFRKPLVAILATGDELVPPGSTPAPSQIIASNTFGVAAMVRDAGADVVDLGIVADDSDAIAAAVQKAVSAKADVLVTLGGASVGDHDLVQSTLKSCGMQLDFWRIAMRPGKPLMVGELDGMQVLGLPGNPVASLVCSLLFLDPLLRELGHRPGIGRHATAISATDLQANDHRQDHLRAKLTRRSDGISVAESFEKQDSSMMKILSRSDCLIVRPPHAPFLKAGSPCPIILFKN